MEGRQLLGNIFLTDKTDKAPPFLFSFLKKYENCDREGTGLKHVANMLKMDEWKDRST
jgi:hypothetical protein